MLAFLKRFLNILLRFLQSFACHPFPTGTLLMLHMVNLFFPVRLGCLNGKGRISILIAYIESYFRRLHLSGEKQGFLVIVDPGRCSNSQLHKMYKRSLFLLDEKTPEVLRQCFLETTSLAKALGSPLFVPLGGNKDVFSMTPQWHSCSPHLEFSENEERRGRRFLRKVGVSNGGFVCLGLRDSAYYKQFRDPKTQKFHLNREAGDDTNIRNPPWENYFPMANQLAAQGIPVFRMGQIVSGRLPSSLHPKIIDYSRDFRTDFLDVFLLANCLFCVSGAGGIWWVASCFNRPVVLTDHYNIEMRTFGPQDLFILQRLWNISEKRFLSFSEMLATRMRYSFEGNCRADNIELVHNSTEEIQVVVEEMVQRLQGIWKTNEEDELLQKRFNDLYTPDYYGHGMKGRIGAAFLRQNQSLIR
jgi:putative glycosyltransferase (TIGR04372 family)